MGANPDLEVVNVVKALLDEVRNDCRLGFRKSFPTGFDDQLENTLDAVTHVLIKRGTIPCLDADAITQMFDAIRMAACMQAGGDWLEAYALACHYLTPDQELILEESMAKTLLCIPALRKLTKSTALLQKSSFSKYVRPRCLDMKDDLALQLGVRVFLCASARWHGADNDACEVIHNNYNKLRWVLILGGNWQQALGDLE